MAALNNNLKQALKWIHEITLKADLNQEKSNLSSW